MTGHSAYRADIDGLRAVSVLAVLVYHAFPSLLPGGFIGVDVFFVISGYLISLIIRRELDNGQFSLSQFYRRRLQRIVPALVPVLITCLVIGWFVLLPAEYEALGKHVASASTFTSNLVFWSESGYFDTNRAYKPLLHLWSLGVEEQFYLVWPLVSVVAYRFGIRPFLLFLGGGSFIINVALVEADPASIFFLPHYRVWELLLGAGLVWFGRSPVPDKNERSTFTALLASLGGLSALVASMFLIDQKYGHLGWPGWWAIPPTVGAALIIMSGAKTSVNRWFLGNGVMVAIGKISYPLYLWHWPLLSFARIMESGEPSVFVRIVIVLLSFLLAWATYALVEKRLRYSRNLLTPIGLGLSLFGLLIIGLVIMSDNGVPSRNAKFQHAVDDSVWAQRLNATCPKGLTTQGSHCTSNGRTHEIVVLGDSHAINLFYALAHRYQNSGEGVQGLAKAGCPTLYGYETPAIGEFYCKEAVKDIVEFVIRSENIHTVYLSSWSRYVPSVVSDVAASADSQHLAATFRLGMESTISRLLGARKQVVLVLDWPTINFNPNSCLSRKLLGEVRQDCFIPNDAYLKDTATYRELLFSLLRQHPSLKYLDAAKVFCERDVCWVKKSGSIFYDNRDHLSIPGSRHLGDNLMLETLSGGTNPLTTDRQPLARGLPSQ
ncbi:MAG: acyltransferase family protein [Halioglobus sp.]